MKKYLSILLFVFILITPSRAQASTLSNLTSVIDSLRKEVKELRVQLAGQTTPPGGVVSNLKYGSTGSEVIALQEFLASKGFYTGVVDGIYGWGTSGALSAYKQSIGFTSYGSTFGGASNWRVAGDPVVSYTVTTTFCQADFDGNNAVQVADYIILQANITSTPTASQMVYDLKSDGVVDARDIKEWMAHYSKSGTNCGTIYTGGSSSGGNTGTGTGPVLSNNTGTAIAGCSVVVGSTAPQPVYVTPNTTGTGVVASSGYSLALGVNDALGLVGSYTSGSYLRRTGPTSFILDSLSGSETYSQSQISNMFSVSGGSITGVDQQSGGNTVVSFSCQNSTEGEVSDNTGNGTFVDISVRGNTNTCGISSTNKLYCWGLDNSTGTHIPKAVTMPAGVTNSFTKVAENLALHSNGKIYHWNSPASGPNQLLIELNTSGIVTNNFIDIDGGTTPSSVKCGIHQSNELYCWKNLGGTSQTVVNFAKVDVSPLGRTNSFKKVSSGGTSCGILSTDEMVCWGNNVYGMAGAGGSITNQQPLPKLMIPTTTGVESTFKDVSVSSDHICAVDTKNVAVCWGLNNFGQLGNGTTITPPEWTNPILASSYTFNPTKVVMPTGIANAFSDIETSHKNTCGLHVTAGTTYCWGSGRFGSIANGVGAGTEAANSTPAKVKMLTTSLPSTFTKMSLGSDVTCGIHTNTKTYCAGFGYTSQLGLPVDPVTGYLSQMKTKFTPVDMTNVN